MKRKNPRLFRRWGAVTYYKADGSVGVIRKEGLYPAYDRFVGGETPKGTRSRDVRVELASPLDTT